MLRLLYNIVPRTVWDFFAAPVRKAKKKKYLGGSRPKTAGETSKARQRRLEEAFFDKYCKGKGLDIGFGGDLVADDADGFDWEHGDAQELINIADETYDYVYSSHTLEHMNNPKKALKNWFRAVKPGGYLILYIPHRDLYEKKSTLPSKFNPDHKSMWLPHHGDGKDTLGLKETIEELFDNYEIIYINVCDRGFVNPGNNVQSLGEYSIEAVIKKT